MGQPDLDRELAQQQALAVELQAQHQSPEVRVCGLYLREVARTWPTDAPLSLPQRLDCQQALLKGITFLIAANASYTRRLKAHGE